MKAQYNHGKCPVCNCLVITNDKRRSTKFHRECYLYFKSIEPSIVGYKILYKLVRIQVGTATGLGKGIKVTKQAIYAALRKLIDLGYVFNSCGNYGITEAGRAKVRSAYYKYKQTEAMNG